MIYEVRINPISGCQELVSLAGVESSTIGCVWKSTDAYACITDCDDCSLGMINGAATQLGYNASASNSSTAIGANATSCCTAIALGCGATATDNGIAIGTNLTACCDEVLIGDKVIIADNTVINGSDGGCSNVVAINATATASCQVVINGLIDVSNTALNVCPEANIYAKVCCDCIDIKGCTAAVNVGADKVSIGASVLGLAHYIAAIGYCPTVLGTGGVSIGCSTTATSGVAIGRGACVTHGVSIGTGTNTCYGVAIGYGACSYGSAIAIGMSAQANSQNVIAIGRSVVTDTNCAGDTFIGYNTNVFKFCAATGYTYGNGCMMTGRILNCAAELPATNCDLLLYYVP